MLILFVKFVFIMSSTEAAACERKPTRPSIIVPDPRPISSEVAASGSRRIPEPTTIKKPATQTVGDLIESNIAEELKSVPAQKRNILKELGLELSDDEAMPAVPKTIMIEPMRGPGICSYKLVKGGKKGLPCGKKSVKGQPFCAAHSTRQSGFDKSSRIVEKDDVKEKLERLEKVVFNLMKDSRAPANKAANPTSSSNLDSVCASLKNINEQISKIQQSAALVSKTHNRKKIRQNIQKIRIYKLNPLETYTLVRYKDGNPIFQIKSNGRYIQVPLPTRMARPIPNGSWSLVCHPEQPLMIWKEV